MKKHLLISLILFAFTSSLCQGQIPTLWGLTTVGGTNNAGIIFNYNVSIGKENIIHNFGNDNDGKIPAGSLIQANDGLLYGMTYAGGAIDSGMIFSFNIFTGIETDIHDFHGGVDGCHPTGSLIQANNGLLYGMTYNGGASGSGTIFSYDINADTENVLHSFGSGTNRDGAYPYGSLIQCNDTLLYGMTWFGGSEYGGTIFSYNIKTGTEVVRYSFGASFNNAFYPTATLTQSGNNLLYGMTYAGGTIDEGTIFSYNILTGIETVIHNFGIGLDGSSPNGSLIQSSDSLLYGMTYSGGTNDTIFGGDGTIFKFNIFTGTETVLYDFGSSFDGKYPAYNILIQVNDSLLCGLATQGGINGDGIVFKYNILTSSEVDLHNFGTGTDGQMPYGGLIVVDSTTGIQRLATCKNNLSVYPNPTSGQFSIKLNNNQNGYRAEVYNILGEKIYQSIVTNSQNIINLISQPPGMYFVDLKSEEGIEVGKVIVTR